ncbi:uncharacterized protein J3R85_014229 [Psidium guajava]|nr:uncharacterized protein J3R85_014229 [Psidium guajava]
MRGSMSPSPPWQLGGGGVRLLHGGVDVVLAVAAAAAALAAAFQPKAQSSRQPSTRLGILALSRLTFSQGC